MTLPQALLALSPFLGLGACFVLHVGISRALPKLSRPHGLGLSVLGGALSIAALPLLGQAWLPAPAGPRELVVVWLVAYVLLAYCYVIGFFNLGESARRIRLLIELYGAGGRGMALGEILAVYNARMIVEARLQRLLSSGQIMERASRYFVKRRLMLHVAKVLAQLKIVLLPRRRRVGVRSPRG